MTQAIIESQDLAQDIKQESPKVSLELPEGYEVDSEEDEDFGELYRIWRGYNFVGSFYRGLDGRWIAQPARGEVVFNLDSDAQAQLAVIHCGRFGQAV